MRRGPREVQSANFSAPKTTSCRENTESQSTLACWNLVQVIDFTRCSVGYLAHSSLTDFYHVDCFEKIADFSQANFLDRLQPLSRNNQNLRGLTIASIMDGNNILDAKAELLTGEWKLTMGRLIDK